MGGSRRQILLVKHAQPVLDPTVPPRQWVLGQEGEAQSRELAGRLAAYLPFNLFSSTEPKAARTAAIVAAQLKIATRSIAGLEELDRRASPIVSAEEHERLNASVFETRDAPTVGEESANDALSRFSAAISHILVTTPPKERIVVVTHGTVIALFLEQQTGANAFDTWRSLRCADFVVA